MTRSRACLEGYEQRVPTNATLELKLNALVFHNGSLPDRMTEVCPADTTKIADLKSIELAD